MAVLRAHQMKLAAALPLVATFSCSHAAAAAEALPAATETYEEFLINNQQTVLVPTLGVGYDTDIHALAFSAPIAELDTVFGVGPLNESISWFSSYVHPLDRNSPELTEEMQTDLASVDADMYWTVGKLTGPYGSVDAVAVAFSVTDANDQRGHFIVPIAAMRSGSAQSVANMVVAVEFLIPPDCHEIYRGRASVAKGDFLGCMADQVKPIGLSSVGCFVLCTPFLAGSPLAYAACAAACNAGVAVGGLINTNTCMDELEGAMQNARDSYCNCIQQTGEPDAVGCTED